LIVAVLVASGGDSVCYRKIASFSHTAIIAPSAELFGGRDDIISIFAMAILQSKRDL